MANETETVIIGADLAGLIAPLNAGIAVVEKFEQLIGSTDAELAALEKTAVRLGEGLKGVVTSIDGLAESTSASGKAANTASGEYGKYGAEVDKVTAQLAALEAEQKRVTGSQLAALKLPTSIGRTPSGQFATPSIDNLSDAQVLQLDRAYALQEQTLRSLVKARVANIGALTEEELALEFSSQQNALYNQILYDQGRALERKAAAQEVANKSLINSRYALYDVSNNLATVGVGLLALPVLSAIIAADYQRDFATVARVTLDAPAKSLTILKQKLIDLSTQIPLTFKEITNIAAEGSQLGIKFPDLVPFTRTVAELAATTQLTTDAAATLLGRYYALGLAGPDNFNKIASAVLNVGVHEAATEPQIVGFATAIAGVGKEAGLTAAQMIALGGALGSTSGQGIQASRGAFTQFFGLVQKATKEGGIGLTAFTQTAGISAKQLQTDFGTSKFSGDLVKFFTGLNKSGVDARQVLNDLGVSSVRYLPILENLAQGSKKYADSIKEANQGYADGSILGQHYAVIQNTLKSQVIELGNKFGAFANQLGASTTGPLTTFVNILGDVLKNLNAFDKNPAGHAILSYGAIALTTAGLIALFGAAITRVTAGLLAAKGGLLALTGLTKEYAVANTAAATSNFRLTTSADGTVTAITAEAVALDTATVSAKGAAVALGVARSAMLGLVVAGVALGGLNSLLGLTDDAKNNEISFKNATEAHKAFNKEVNLAANQNTPGFASGGSRGKLLTEVTGANGGVGQAFKGGFGTGIDVGNLAFGYAESKTAIDKVDASMAKLVAGGNAKTAAKEFDRWKESAKQLGLTTANLNSKFPLYTKSIKDHGVAITGTAGATNLIQNLSKVQLKYVTDLTAAYVGAIKPLGDFNNIVSEVQTNNQKLKKNYNGTSVSLADFTQRLVDNNTAGQTYLTNIQKVATADGGKIAQQFITAGYTVTNASILAQLVKATPAQRAAYIKATTDSIKLAANAASQSLLTNPYLSQGGKRLTQKAADEFGYLTQNLGESVDKALTDLHIKVSQTVLPPIKIHADIDPAVATLNALIAAASGGKAVIKVGTTGHPAYISALHNYADGGYTGAGAKYEPAGTVHKGEYVIPQEGVDQRTQTPKPYWSGGYVAAASKTSYASGGYVNPFNNGGPAPMTIELGPRTLRRIGGGPAPIYLDGSAIAQAVNNHNAIRGSRR